MLPSLGECQRQTHLASLNLARFRFLASLQESADAKVEDARGGLSTAELTPNIILSESFAGH